MSLSVRKRKRLAPSLCIGMLELISPALEAVDSCKTHVHNNGRAASNPLENPLENFTLRGAINHERVPLRYSLYCAKVSSSAVDDYYEHVYEVDEDQMTDGSSSGFSTLTSRGRLSSASGEGHLPGDDEHCHDVGGNPDHGTADEATRGCTIQSSHELGAAVRGQSTPADDGRERTAQGLRGRSDEGVCSSQLV